MMDFYKQFRDLVLSRPHNSITSKGITNAACSDFVVRSKNIYMSFFMTDCEDCYYDDFVSNSRDCMDCSYVTECELCYECFDCHGCFGCQFLISCINCSESEYLQNCYNCKNCFGCVGLINKEHCILNRQFTPEEYLFALEKIKKELKEKNVYGKSLAEILQ